MHVFTVVDGGAGNDAAMPRCRATPFPVFLFLPNPIRIWPPLGASWPSLSSTKKTKNASACCVFVYTVLPCPAQLVRSMRVVDKTLASAKQRQESETIKPSIRRCCDDGLCGAERGGGMMRVWSLVSVSPHFRPRPRPSSAITRGGGE